MVKGFYGTLRVWMMTIEDSKNSFLREQTVIHILSIAKGNIFRRPHPHIKMFPSVSEG